MSDASASVRSNAVPAGVAALLLLLFGFWSAPVGISDSEFYNFTADLFRWTLQLGGIALLGVALACAVGWRAGLLIDATVSGLCGALLLLIGAYWVFVDADVQSVLIVLFGGLFVHAAVRCRALYRATAGPRPPHPETFTVEAPPPAPSEPVEPIPAEPPPPDGSLAALGRRARERRSAANKDE